MQHEVTNDRDSICNMRLPTIEPYMQQEVINGRDHICNMKLPNVGNLYATSGYQWSRPYMQHEVTNGRDPI